MIMYSLHTSVVRLHQFGRNLLPALQLDFRKLCNSFFISTAHMLCTSDLTEESILLFQCHEWMDGCRRSHIRHHPSTIRRISRVLCVWLHRSLYILLAYMPWTLFHKPQQNIIIFYVRVRRPQFFRHRRIRGFYHKIIYILGHVVVRDCHWHFFSVWIIYISAS